MTRPRANPQAPWTREKEARRLVSRETEWAEAPCRKLLDACHPKQRAFVEDPALRLTALCSRGGGKSTAALAKLLIAMMRRPKLPCLFIATTREQATEILWPHLKDVIDKLGIPATFAEVRRTMTLTANGSTLRLCGADDRKEIDKLRGLAFGGVVIDEAASHDEKLLENLVVRVLGPRLGEHDGWIALIGTPGHELRGMFYDATRPKGPLHRPYAERELDQWEGFLGWSSHRWTLEDGAPYVRAMAKLWEQALVDKATHGWSDSHPIWLREYRAQWAADDTDNVFRYRPHDEDGAPFNQWDPPRVGALRVAELPPGRDDWQHVIAFDKGFADEFAVNVFAFSPTDNARTIYHRFCFEQTAFYARRFAELLLGEELKPEVPAGLIGALGGEPSAIVGDTDEAFLSELRNVYGITATQTKKARDYKFGAIELTNGDFVDGRIRVLKGSALEAQLTELQWVTDEFGALRENKAQANHSTDCLIYGRKAIAILFETGEATKPRARPAAPGRPAARFLEDEEDGAPTPEWSRSLAPGRYGGTTW